MYGHVYLHKYLYTYNLSFVGPSALAVNVIESINSLSVIVQWDDEVDDSLNTTYIVTCTSERDLNSVQSHTLIEQSTYTITGLTPGAIYTITVTATNMCGTGSEYRTTISLSAGTTTPIIPVISPTVTASILTSVCCTTTTNNILVSAANDNNLADTDSKCSSTT